MIPPQRGNREETVSPGDSFHTAITASKAKLSPETSALASLKCHTEWGFHAS